uniref:Small ribosomal subunit protein uS15m n=1 Tax=Corvus moneduloides TaxID=1196302 RepID=A0A8U7MYT0_CORMO
MSLCFSHPVCSPVLQAARGYARRVTRKRKDIPSHLDDLPPTLLKKDYANLPIMNSVDDVVKRLLSLEMASQKEKMKVKTQQLVEKVRRSPNDSGSFEVQVAILTARIRTLEEHLQRHPKDKSNRRCMLMDVDRRRKMLGYLRRVNYSTFESTCKQLDIQYSPPPALHPPCHQALAGQEGSLHQGIPGEAEAESSREAEAEERVAGESKGSTGTAGEAGAREAGTGGDSCVVAQPGWHRQADNKHLPKDLKPLLM